MKVIPKNPQNVQLNLSISGNYRLFLDATRNYNVVPEPLETTVCPRHFWKLQVNSRPPRDYNVVQHLPRNYRFALDFLWKLQIRF